MSIVKCCPDNFYKREYYFLCPNPNCELLYFDAIGGPVAKKSDAKCRVGFKEKEGPHTVCYCFGHSVESIAQEIAQSGKTDVVDRIKAKVKARQCICDVKNPQGTCCLGAVGRVVAELMAAHGDLEKVRFGPTGEQCVFAPDSTEDHSDCCNPKDLEHRK